MNGWILLFIAGLFEVAWASLLPVTRGFTRLWPSLGFLGTLVVSMYLLSLATRTIPIGTAYAVWVGIGAVGTAVVGILVYGEDTRLTRLAALAFLVLALVVVKSTSR